MKAISLLLFCLLSSVAFSVPVQWTEGNGHYYEVIAEEISWLNAKNAAEQKSYLGFSGYLATITSSDEQNLIADLVADAGLTSALLGGYQDPTAPDFSEPAGGWRWITGEAWVYSNWRLGEPSDNSPGEEALHVYASNHEFLGKWNDIPNDYVLPEGHGYVVEYVVPEPATLMLLGLGGLLIRKR